MDKKKILIADDDTHVHKLLTATINSDKFEVIHSYNGQKTMELIAREHPDLIVLDIVMPIKDGRDICKDLKKNPETKDILVLMLSSKDEQFDRTLGLKLGADDYATKPFSPTIIADMIERMILRK